MQQLTDKVPDFKDLFNKIIQDLIKPEEKKALQRYICLCYKDEGLFSMMEDHWQYVSGHSAEADTNEAERLEKIKAYILSTIQKEQKRGTKAITLSFIQKKFTWLVAAVIILPVFLLLSYFFIRFGPLTNTQMVEISSPFGKIRAFTLPDSTKVWLNNGSSLKYPAHFNRQKKRITELKGEAYFKVAHNPGKPFLVNAGNVSVTVLGTSFDISAYENDPIITTTLQEGLITITNSALKEEKQLKPGEEAIFEKQNNKMTIIKAPGHSESSWKKGIITLNETSLEEASRILERHFGCTVYIDKQLSGSDIKYTATITGESLEEVLKMLEIASPIKTTIKGKEVYISSKK